MQGIDLTDEKQAVAEATGFFVDLGKRFTNFLPTLVIAVIVFVVGLILARLILKLVQLAMRRSKLDAASAGFGQSFVKILLYVILAAVFLSMVGVPPATVITLLGTAGVAIGLALQNTLSNLAGGFLIMLAKPFRSGDYIRVGDAEGYVESVTILYTTLRALDNRVFYLPNGSVSAGQIVNLSEKGTLRVNPSLSVSYSTDIDKARSAILTALAAEQKILKDPPPVVVVTELGDSGVKLTVFAWVNKSDYIAAPSRILEVSKKALDAAGIEIPFPQVVVHAAKTEVLYGED